MEGNKLDRIAILISHLLNPALVAFWVFGWGGWLVGGNWVAALIGVAFYALLPGLALLFLLRLGYICELYPSGQKQRAGLLLLGALSYFLGFMGLGLVGAPGFMLGGGVAYFINALLVWQINKYWKISIHSVGVSGGILIIWVAAGPQAWPLVLAWPLVAWARLNIKAHTPAQVVAGALLGGSSTGLLLFLTNWFYNPGGALLYR